MTAFRIATPRRATFSISGVQTRDACSLANTKRALVTDAEAYLKSVIADNSDDAPTPSFEVTEHLEVLTEPTCVFADDDSVTRTAGLATLTVVVTACA
jgi:hypothetical protein